MKETDLVKISSGLDSKRPSCLTAVNKHINHRLIRRRWARSGLWVNCTYYTIRRTASNPHLYSYRWSNCGDTAMSLVRLNAAVPQLLRIVVIWWRAGSYRRAFRYRRFKVGVEKEKYRFNDLSAEQRDWPGGRTQSLMHRDITR